MGCRSCHSNPCACNTVPLPYYEDLCYQQSQCEGTVVVSQYSTVISIPTEWAIPEANEVVTLSVNALADILIGSCIWNPTYGFYFVESYDQEAQKIKVRHDPDSSTDIGIVIPSCTKFVVTTSVSPELFQRLRQVVGILQFEVEGLTDYVTSLAEQITQVYEDFKIDYSDFTPATSLEDGTLVVNSTVAEYSFSGQTCFIRFNQNLTISVNDSLYVEFELPFQAVSGDPQYVPGIAISGGVGTPVYFEVINGTTKCRIYKSDGTDFGQTTWAFPLNFFYKRIPA